MSTTSTGQSGVRESRWVLVLPYLIMSAAAAVLAYKWNSIPERWPIHWRGSGQPDGWAVKSIGGVFLPLAIGAGVCVFLELICLLVRAQAKRRRGMPVETALAIADLSVGLVRLVEIALAIVFSFISLALPLRKTGDPVRMIWFVFIVVGAAIAYGSWRLLSGVREMKRAGYQGLEGYNGIIYRNPDDPRLLVPKISGVGYTLNFGNPWAWPIVIAILAAVVLVIALGGFAGFKHSTTL